MKTQELKQKLVIDPKGHIEGVNKAKENLRSAAQDMNKNLVDNSKQFSQNESQVKKWGNSIADSLRQAGQNFKENLATGAKAATLGFGGAALKKSAEDAVSLAMDASEAFAQVAARVGASQSKIDKWRDAIGNSAIKTKASLSQMTSAFREISKYTDPDEIVKFSDALGQAILLSGGDQDAVSSFLNTSIRGQGKEINKGTVDEALGGADLLARNGLGFDMKAAMAAMGGLDQNALKMSGLDSRKIAALMAGASRAGAGENAGSGINALLKQGAMGEYSPLAAMLGIGSLKGKDGKFDLSNLGKGNSALNRMGNDEATRLQTFKQISGLGDQESEVVFKMIRNFEKMNETVIKTERDQRTLGETAQQAGKNLKANYQMFENTLVKGFQDIFGGFEKPLNALMDGDYKGAISGTGSAIGQMGKGIADHPLLAAGSIATLAGGGAIINSLLKGKGGGILGNAGGLAKGVGVGAALSKMGVQPVYVVNAQEIGNNMSMTPKGIADLLGFKGGAAGAAGGIAKKAGFLGRMLPALGIAAKGAGGVGLAAAGGYAVGTGLSALDQKYGQFSTGEGADKFTGTAFQQLLNKIDKLTNGMLSGVKVEIDSKDPMFSGVPRAMDNQRSARSF